MISNSRKSSSLLKVASSSRRNVVAQFLVACLLIQTVAPAAFASQPGPRPARASAGGLLGGAASYVHALALGAGDLAIRRRRLR